MVYLRVVQIYLKLVTSRRLKSLFTILVRKEFSRKVIPRFLAIEVSSCSRCFTFGTMFFLILCKELIFLPLSLPSIYCLMNSSSFLEVFYKEPKYNSKNMNHPLSQDTIQITGIICFASSRTGLAFKHETVAGTYDWPRPLGSPPPPNDVSQTPPFQFSPHCMNTQSN